MWVAGCLALGFHSKPLLQASKLVLPVLPMGKLLHLNCAISEVAGYYECTSTSNKHQIQQSR
jgi:hypothetical protein